MSSRICIIFFIVKIFGSTSALVELPQVEENNILITDKSIRETTNKLFSIIKLNINARPILKQYSLIHNHLVSNSLQDYTNLIEIAKLTRVDKTKLNNQIRNFITMLNEILNEDVKHDIETEDQYVIKHIEGFLKNLDEYTDTYNYTQNNTNIIYHEILNFLENKYSYNFSNRFHLSDVIDTRSIDRNEFWVPNARRIFQGEKANIKDFPFVASIQVFNHFQCAGSIIKSDLILTAASCLQLAWNNRFFRENPLFLSARVGSTFHNGGGENIPVVEVQFHPDYDPRSLHHNLCVLRLLRTLHFTRKGHKLKKIDIDRNASPLPSNSEGITIVGWGARQRSNIVTDTYLSVAVLDFIPLYDCREIYSTNYVTANNFCAGFLSRGGGACNRDIGAPGVVRGFLSGVVSFGSPSCGTPDAPTVFTKVGYYAEWIQSIMDQDVPNAKKRTTKLPPFIVYTVPLPPSQTTFKLKPLGSQQVPSLTAEESALRILRDNPLLKELINAINQSRIHLNITGKKQIVNTFENKLVSSEPHTLSSTGVSFRELLINSSEVLTKPQKSEDNSYETVEDESKETSEVALELSIVNKNTIHNETITLEELFIRNKDEESNIKFENGLIKITDEVNAGKDIKSDDEVMFFRNRQYDSNNTDSMAPATTHDNQTYSEEYSSNEKDSDESGMDIATDIFNDTSYMNETGNLLISKQEILQVISDALKEEHENKTKTT